MINYLGVNIKAIREEWGLSQEEFGILIGASRGMVMQYEKRGSIPKNATVSKIVSVTGLSKDILFNELLEQKEIPSIKQQDWMEIENFRSDPDSYNTDESEEDVKELVGTLKAKAGKEKEVIPLGKHVPLRLKPGEYAEAFGDWRGLPMYNVPITASFVATYRDEGIYRPQYYLHDPRFIDCDFGAIISGDSMHSEIRHGDFVACKEITDIGFLVFGDIYYIVAKNGLETCKYLNAGRNDNEVMLLARNEKISPSPLPKDMILSLYKVRGIIRSY